MILPIVILARMQTSLTVHPHTLLAHLHNARAARLATLHTRSRGPSSFASSVSFSSPFHRRPRHKSSRSGDFTSGTGTNALTGDAGKRASGSGGGGSGGDGSLDTGPAVATATPLSQRYRAVRLDCLKQHSAAEILQFAQAHRREMAARGAALAQEVRGQQAAAAASTTGAARAPAVRAVDAAAVFRQLEQRRRAPPPSRLRPLRSLGDWPQGRALRGGAPVLGEAGADGTTAARGMRTQTSVPLARPPRVTADAATRSAVASQPAAPAGAAADESAVSTPQPAAESTDIHAQSPVSGELQPPSDPDDEARLIQLALQGMAGYGHTPQQQSLYHHRVQQIALGSSAARSTVLHGSEGGGGGSPEAAQNGGYRTDGGHAGPGVEGGPARRRWQIWGGRRHKRGLAQGDPGGVGEGAEAALLKNRSGDVAPALAQGLPLPVRHVARGRRRRSGGDGYASTQHAETLLRGDPAAGVWSCRATGLEIMRSLGQQQGELQSPSLDSRRRVDTEHSMELEGSQRDGCSGSAVRDSDGVSDGGSDGRAVTRRNLAQKVSGVYTSMMDSLTRGLRTQREEQPGAEPGDDGAAEGWTRSFGRVWRELRAPWGSRVAPFAASRPGSVVHSVKRGIMHSFTATLGRVSTAFAGRAVQRQLKAMQELEEEVAEAYIVAEVERAQHDQERFAGQLRQFLVAHPELRDSVEEVLGGAVWEPKGVDADSHHAGETHEVDQEGGGWDEDISGRGAECGGARSRQGTAGMGLDRSSGQGGNTDRCAARQRGDVAMHICVLCLQCSIHISMAWTADMWPARSPPCNLAVLESLDVAAPVAALASGLTAVDNKQLL